MKGLLAFLLACSIALAGCGGKDKVSAADLDADVDAALDRLAQDLGPGGAISAAALSVPLDAGFATINVPLALTIGPDGDMRIDGSFGFGSKRVTVEAYCNHERLVVITEGLPEFDAEAVDWSLELRNTQGTCLQVQGEAAELLGGFGGMQELLAGGDRLQRTQISKVEDALSATHVDRLTGATVVVDVEDGQVLRVRASADEGELTVQFTYGQRTALVVPQAQARGAVPVDWRIERGAASGEPGIVTITNGTIPLDEAHVRIYSQSAAIPCRGGPSPLATFDLSKGDRQERDGYTMELHDDGDDALDAGDRIFLWHPERLQEGFPHKVEVWDGWSDGSADPVCTIAGPAPVAIIGVLALLVVLARR